MKSIKRKWRTKTWLLGLILVFVIFLSWIWLTQLSSVRAEPEEYIITNVTEVCITLNIGCLMISEVVLRISVTPRMAESTAKNSARFFHGKILKTALFGIFSLILQTTGQIEVKKFL